MLAFRVLAPICALSLLACTTEDVDPGRRTTNSGPPAKAPYPYESTWVARPNPELGATTGLYAWRNVVILGGGFVTGIEFSQAEADLIYARTDVGGAYRWDAAADRWIPITDWVGRDDSNLMGIESIAPDPTNAERVYIAAGTYLTAGNGKILSSEDRGATWQVNDIAAPMGGNVNGRSMGERLAVDPNLPSTLYFASRSTGLWKSTDSAASWEPVSSFTASGDPDLGLSFVYFDKRSATAQGSSTLYVGVATLSAPSLYRSTDAGQSWEAVPGTPEGLMPHHAVMDAEGVLYLTFNDWAGPNDIKAGGVHKYDTAADTWTDITPLAANPDATLGYGGVTLDPSRAGTLMTTTIDRWSPDLIFRSNDGGNSWFELGAGAARDLWGAEYLRWHRAEPTTTGWMGDIELDPFNTQRALYITGQGIWWSDDVGAADDGGGTHWSFRDQGLEETVPLALISPPSGPHLISGLGDIAGFRHDDLDAPPPFGMFENPIFGNTTSLDFAELAPEMVVRVGTSSNAGGRGAISLDGGEYWEPFDNEPMSSTGEGSIAIAADGSAIVWAPRRTPASLTTDRGSSWTTCMGLPGSLRVVAADRVNPQKFYALASGMSGGQIYVSTDGGASFSPSPNAIFPEAQRLRAAPGHEGDVWLVASNGLFHSSDSAQSFEQIEGSEWAQALGFGMAAEEGGYPAVYLIGSAGGVSGILRSDDAGESFVRIDDDEHQFGYLSHITGDPRIYGRVYIGTGGRGVIYGDLR